LHLRGRNPAYFFERLPATCQWRLFRDFQDFCAFLDIETTGLTDSAEITTIALYDGQSLRTYVNGHNLADFVGDVQGYRLLVTYNGKCFDIPFIERFFSVRLHHAHIDLRYVLRRLGLAGGLKVCERKLGLARPGFQELDGFSAVLLWEDYRRHNNGKALETLLAYNAQDALSLQTLMVHAHNENLRQTPFENSHRLPQPGQPPCPFRADPNTVERVVTRHFEFGRPQTQSPRAREAGWIVPAGTRGHGVL
jgi:uncharacterized protein YprB with RNaseH-like and TPR domain